MEKIDQQRALLEIIRANNKIMDKLQDLLLAAPIINHQYRHQLEIIERNNNSVKTQLYDIIDNIGGEKALARSLQSDPWPKKPLE